MIGNPQQSYIDDRLNEMLSQWAQKVYEGKNLVTKEVKKSVHQAVEDNRSYFDYIDEQLFFQYPKSQLTGTGSTFEHFKNSLTPGVWVGYMKIIDDGSVFFLGTHHLSYKPCIICYSSEDYAHILSHKQRESKRLDVDCYIISPYSYGYQDWCQKRPYILIRPDMIILNIYQAHEIANVVTDYKALLE